MSFTVVINTRAHDAAVTVPPLLQSLELAGVPGDSVLVVCGGGGADAEPGWRREPGCSPITGLVHVSRHPDSVRTPWVLYLQDTMVVGKEFWPRAAEVARQLTEAPSTSDHPVRCVRMLDAKSHGVGFYSVAWLEALALADEPAAADDAVFDLCDPQSTKFLGHYDDLDQRCVVGEFRYRDGDPARPIEHCPVLDVYKFV